MGGTPLSRWSKGGDLYQNAVARAKVAMKDGTLQGVLWHQGESDSGSLETADTYARRLATMIGRGLFPLTRRTVRRGVSARIVPMPTRMAS